MRQCGTVMKCVRILIALFVFSLSISAAEYRLWFDAKTNKSITAETLDKRLDNSEVKVRIKGGRIVWIKTARLCAEDIEFVKSWVKPVDHLTARVVGFRRGGIKKLKITAQAGGKDMKVVIYKTAHDGLTKTELLSPGEVREIVIEVRSDYEVKAWEGETDVDGDVVWGDLVDEESHRRKTGL